MVFSFLAIFVAAGSAVISYARDRRRIVDDARKKLICELQDALAEIKTLQGILPICSHCKKIRDEEGDWNRIETYIREHSDAEFTHGMCPECIKEFYPEVADEE